MSVTAELLEAAIKGDQETVRKILDSGKVDVNHIHTRQGSEEDGLTTLGIAAFHGHGEMVKFLIEKKAALVKGDKRAHAIRAAILGRKPEILNIFSERGYLNDEFFEENPSPLTIAIGAIVRVYQNADREKKAGGDREKTAGSEQEIKTGSDKVPKAEVVRQKKTEADREVKEEADQKPKDVKEGSDKEREVKSGSDRKVASDQTVNEKVEQGLKCIEILLKSYPDPSEMPWSHPIHTPLTLAVSLGCGPVVQLLGNFRFDPNQRNDKKETPLQVALLSDNPDIAIDLILAGANIHKPINSIKKIRRSSPSDENSDEDSEEEFVERKYQCSALVYAITKAGDKSLPPDKRAEYRQLVYTLVEKGADLNLKDSGKWGPVEWAIKTSDFELYRFLLSKGAYRDPDLMSFAALHLSEDSDVYKKFNDAIKADMKLYVGMFKNEKEVAELLAQGGGLLHVNAYDLKTPLHAALTQGRLERAKVKALLEHVKKLLPAERLRLFKAKDSKGYTILDLFALQHHKAVKLRKNNDKLQVEMEQNSKDIKRLCEEGSDETKKAAEQIKEEQDLNQAEFQRSSEKLVKLSESINGVRSDLEEIIQPFIDGLVAFRKQVYGKEADGFAFSEEDFRFVEDHAYPMATREESQHLIYRAIEKASTDPKLNEKVREFRRKNRQPMQQMHASSAVFGLEVADIKYGKDRPGVAAAPAASGPGPGPGLGAGPSPAPGSAPEAPAGTKPTSSAAPHGADNKPDKHKP